MWKLTITQKRKSEFSDNMITESVVFTDNNILNLTSLVDKVTEMVADVETSYKIEKVVPKGESGNE